MALDPTKITYPAGSEVIEQVLPHRKPFAWLSRILSCEPGVSCVAELDIDPASPIFEGHFPSYPVFPGVLLLEALAQAGSFSVMVQPENQGRVGFFGSMDNVKFRNQVRPGDVVRLETRVTKSSRRVVKLHGQAFVGDVLCAEADQMCVMG